MKKFLEMMVVVAHVFDSATNPGECVFLRVLILSFAPSMQYYR